MQEYTSDKRYIEARTAFQETITTSELTRESILRGWELFVSCDQVRNSIINKKGSASLADIHVIHILKGLKGEGIQGNGIDTTTASLGHFIFQLATYEPFNHTKGYLFEGINEDLLEKATSFCKEMDDIGWRTGDFDQKYPPVDTSIQENQ